jgi:hypothetical protein
VPGTPRVGGVTGNPSRRLARLAEELEEGGLPALAGAAFRDLLVEEVDQALRPAVHERRVPSGGTFVEPTSPVENWGDLTQLEIVRTPVRGHPLADSRRFADGLSSWLARRASGEDEWLMFDRPAGSERDLVVLAGALSATVVQRHPSGMVRVVGDFGVLRNEGLGWHHEPPVSAWLDHVMEAGAGDPVVLRALLSFAVHDLGAQGIGALLIYRPDGSPGPAVEERLPPPPPLRVGKAFHLAPLRHALAQIDGAAVFDRAGVLRQLGVRVVPSSEAEDRVEALRGTRHTSGRRYSYDDSSATVIVVSEDGPVTVVRDGAIVGSSRA